MPKNEFEFINCVKNEENIIVYSDTPIAATVTECLISNGLLPKTYVAGIKNVHGRRLLNFNIADIHTLTHINKNSVVIIAVKEKFLDEVEKFLTGLGFAKTVKISRDLFMQLNLRYDTHVHELNFKKQEALQYRTMNLIKLNRLRDKFNNGKKIHVMYIVTSKAKSAFASVYKAFSNKEMFEISIFYICDNIDECSDAALWNETYKHACELKEKGYNVIWGYDDLNNPIPIDTYSPDIVFFNYPRIFNNKCGHSIYKIATDYLACYFHYGLHVSNNLVYHFEYETILPVWTHFIDFRPAYDLCISNSLNKGINAVLSGHPVFDAYTKELETEQFQKVLNGNKTIIYAPHWKLEDSPNISSFHLHYNYFINLLNEYPNINFVLKPHPRLRLEIQRRKPGKGMESLADYDSYCEKWNNAPNGLVITDNSYIDLFRISDCLITDSYAFLMAWLPTEKPCIYPLSPYAPDNFLDNYYDYIRGVINSYYIARTEEEIENTINDVIVKANDPKLCDRQKMKEQLIYNFGNAGQFIADYVEKQLLN